MGQLPPNMFIYYYRFKDWWVEHRQTLTGPSFEGFFEGLSNDEVWSYLEMGRDLYEEYQRGTTNT